MEEKYKYRALAPALTKQANILAGRLQPHDMGNPRMACGDSRMACGDSLMACGDSRMTCGDSRMTRGDSLMACGDIPAAQKYGKRGFLPSCSQNKGNALSKAGCTMYATPALEVGGTSALVWGVHTGAVWGIHTRAVWGVHTRG